RRARRRRSLLADPAPAAATLRPAAANAAARAAAARGLRRDPRLPRARGAARVDVRADPRRAGGARARDLARRKGCRRRPLAAPVLRDGSAALPRHARPVHGQRLLRAPTLLPQL